MKKLTKDILYYRFRPYVASEKLTEFDKEYLKVKNSKKSIKSFFTKFVDIEHYHKYPKSPEDAGLFNYFVVEMDLFGLTKKSDLIKGFRNKN